MENPRGWYQREANLMKNAVVVLFNFYPVYKINNAICNELQ